MALAVFALLAATGSVSFFLSGASPAAGDQEGNASGESGESSEDASTADQGDASPRTTAADEKEQAGRPVPIKKADAYPARTPATKEGEHTHRLGESVLFENGTAIRIDSIEPAKIWPGSKHDLMLDDPRVFAIRYTYTNFSDLPVEVGRLHSLNLNAEPWDPDLEWPEVKYPSITESNSAVLPDGLSALSWPELEQGAGGYPLAAGESVQGVLVTFEIRKGEAKLKLDIGKYREEGQAWFLLDVPK